MLASEDGKTMNPWPIRWSGFWFDHLLLRVLAILACLWLWTHMKPTPVVELQTPTMTKTVVKNFASLPPLPGLEEPAK
jgi:hypothetical protein